MIPFPDEDPKAFAMAMQYLYGREVFFAGVDPAFNLLEIARVFEIRPPPPCCWPRCPPTPASTHCCWPCHPATLLAPLVPLHLSPSPASPAACRPTSGRQPPVAAAGQAIL